MIFQCQGKGKRLEGSYYPIVHIDKEGFDGDHPCLIIKDRNEYLLAEFSLTAKIRVTWFLIS